MITSVLDPAGPIAASISETAGLLIAGATLIFIAMMALLAAVLTRRRSAPDDARLVRRWVLGGGLAFPAVVMAALLAHTASRSVALSPELAADETLVTVTAHSWWWEVRYRGAPGAPDIVSANEVHIPAGRPVTLGLASADVIHSFWVPALAGKIDMVPGRIHRLRLQADRPGAWRGQCAEFCGAQHARMALRVVAHAPADYERWLAAQATAAPEATDAVALRGRALFESQRCSACHALRGQSTGLGLGPDLTHLGRRAELGAGALPMDHASLAAWIADPHRFKPGVRMPAYGARLDPASLAALAAFLAADR